MSEDAIKQYVIKNITDPVVNAFENTKNLNTPEQIADYIWSNIVSMRETSQPVSQAPGRGIMPQAADVPGGITKTWIGLVLKKWQHVFVKRLTRSCLPIKTTVQHYKPLRNSLS